MGRKLQTVLRLLSGPIPRGESSWRARCPAHEDPSPSLNIDVDGDKILLHCMAGCPTARVIARLGLTWSDLFEDGDYSSVSRQPGVPTTGSTAASESIRDEVYQKVLSRLELSDQHRQDLRHRGLSDERINLNGYRSLTYLSGSRIARELEEEYEDELYTIPGFVQRLAGPRMTVREGLVIPVRGLGLPVVALQVRTGGRDSKYLWLSSRHTTIGSPVHVGRMEKTSPYVPVVRITEGPLKADVATYLDPKQVPTIAVPSVSQWKSVLPVLGQMKVVQVRIAFDSDWQTNDGVARAIQELGDYLSNEYEVVCETWDPSLGKGIDDLFLNGHEPQVVTEADLAEQMGEL